MPFWTNTTAIVMGLASCSGHEGAFVAVHGDGELLQFVVVDAAGKLIAFEVVDVCLFTKAHSIKSAESLLFRAVILRPKWRRIMRWRLELNC